MPIKLEHKFKSQKPDSVDNTLIRPSDWNEQHIFNMATGAVIGRRSSGTGEAEEIPINYFATEEASLSRYNTLSTNINSRVSRNGDTISGDLEIYNTGIPKLFFHRPNVKRGNLNVNQNGELVWEDQDGSDHFKVDSSGAIWSAQMGDLATRIETRAGVIADDRVARLNYRTVSETYIAPSSSGNAVGPAGALLFGLNFGSTAGSQGRAINGIHYRTLQIFDPVRGWVGFQRS